MASGRCGQTKGSRPVGHLCQTEGENTTRVLVWISANQYPFSFSLSLSDIFAICSALCCSMSVRASVPYPFSLSRPSTYSLCTLCMHGIAFCPFTSCSHSNKLLLFACLKPLSILFSIYPHHHARAGQNIKDLHASVASLFMQVS